MKKIDLAYGFIIGIVSAFIGTFLFVSLFTDHGFINGIRIMKADQQLGKLITLGAVLNLVLFFLLLKKNKELMARGIILATIAITIITLFV